MNGGNIDLGQLQATMQAIEIACTSIQVSFLQIAPTSTTHFMPLIYKYIKYVYIYIGCY